MKLFRKRILSFTAIFLFLIVLIFTAVYLKSVADYKRSVKETTFSNLDISNVPDGVYVGEYDVDFVYAKVEVTVQNGMITNIDIGLLHFFLGVFLHFITGADNRY